MPPNSVTVRHAAMYAPILLLAYGLMRLIDGLDGTHGPGLAWNLGHLAFFAATVLFGVLAAVVRPLVPAGAHTVATVAAGAVVAGVACFLWVIAGDLSAAFHEAAPLPEPLLTAGPLLFSLGMLTLLGLLVAARRTPAWSPLLFGAGVAAIIIDIDFLPLAALILLAALSPLARPAPVQSTSARPAFVGPASVRSASAGSTSVRSASVRSASVGPASVRSAPARIVAADARPALGPGRGA